MNLKNRYGQSTLEYVIILAVVVGAVVAGAYIFKPEIKKAYEYVYTPPPVVTPPPEAPHNPPGQYPY